MNRDRPTKWRLAPPTEGQLALLARYGISAPEGATQGEVSDMLDWCSELGSTYRGRDYCECCLEPREHCNCEDEDDLDADAHDSEGA